ncbi:signal peptidase I [Streptomyces sp. BE133]|uniref:signal peptidase I n=1 Tax=Streptomyces sp. BE133 TaxID=3002523 RepID=UPI002E775899|nr:signal peptidase I [Streptomyces sp. BE133]
MRPWRSAGARCSSHAVARPAPTPDAWGGVPTGHPTPHAEPVLRRVIGIGGDQVSGAGNRVTVNGKPLDEPYVTDADENVMAGTYDVKVPHGRLFVLGDHRTNANDSRYHLSEQSGSFAASGVQGRALEDSAAPKRAWRPLPPSAPRAVA